MNRLFAEIAPHGFMVNLFPKATIEELIEAHDLTVQAVLTDSNVGLRKLTRENWRPHVLYASRLFDRIKFDLGKIDTAPQPFVFPAGELAQDDCSKADFETGHQKQTASPVITG